jgi:hypothetical protein
MLRYQALATVTVIEQHKESLGEITTDALLEATALLGLQERSYTNLLDTQIHSTYKKLSPMVRVLVSAPLCPVDVFI